VLQSVPGAAILIGGTITALGNPRAALAVAGAGSLAIAGLFWIMLADIGPRLEPAGGAPPPPAPADLPPQPPAPTPSASPTEPDLAQPGDRREHAPTPVVPHQ
jgi:hypothetical protein